MPGEIVVECLPECRYCHPEPKTCVKCHQVLPLAVQHRNLDGGMLLQLHGWYGGTIDPFRPIDVWLCDACAREFLEVNRPWLAKPLSEGH